MGEPETVVRWTRLAGSGESAAWAEAIKAVLEKSN